MDYSVCLLLLLSSISSVSVGAGFPTAQMWVQLQKQPVGFLKKKSWIIRCVWLFIRAHPNNDIPWNKHWCYIQYVFLCFMFSLYCSWWNIIPFAPQRVLLSQVMMIAHYLGCSFTLWNRIFKAAFFPRCCQLAAGGHVSCCQRNPDSSSEFGSGASKLFPAAFHPHWMWSLEFFSDWRIL